MHTFTDVVSLFVALCCAITDLYRRKIYNYLTYSAAVVGLLAGIMGGKTAFMSSASGLLIGGFLYYLAFRSGGLGAGDVKLMAAIGALKGLQFVLLSSFYVICAGVVWGLFTLAWTDSLVSILRRRESVDAGSKPRNSHSMPFAPAVFCGIAYSIYLENISGSLEFGSWFTS